MKRESIASIGPGLLAVAITILLGAVHVSAAEPLIYRRVLVPADTLDSQIHGLLPMKRDEFERRVATAGLASASVAEAGVRLEEAIFEARLDGAELSGAARLHVAYTAKGSALLPIEPCSFVLESVAWRKTEKQPAVFGR